MLKGLIVGNLLLWLGAGGLVLLGTYSLGFMHGGRGQDESYERGHRDGWMACRRAYLDIQGVHVVIPRPSGQSAVPRGVPHPPAPDGTMVPVHRDPDATTRLPRVS